MTGVFVTDVTRADSRVDPDEKEEESRNAGKTCRSVTVCIVLTKFTIQTKLTMVSSSFIVGFFRLIAGV